MGKLYNPIALGKYSNLITKSSIGEVVMFGAEAG